MFISSKTAQKKSQETCYFQRQNAFSDRNQLTEMTKAQTSHSEGTSCCSHCAARPLICSKFRIAGSPSRTIVARLRSLGSNIIALATAEHSFIVP